MKRKYCRFDRALCAALAALVLLALLTAAPWTRQPPAGQTPFPQAAQDRIDLNTAPAAELQCLPGIGEKRAQAIVAFRAENGPFQSAEELQKVKGISQAIARAAAPYVTVR